MPQTTTSPSVNDVVATRSITRLPDGRFLVPFESNGGDDFYDTDHWSRESPNELTFSSNIRVIAATYISIGGAAVVEKIDPSIPETLILHDPDGPAITIIF